MTVTQREVSARGETYRQPWEHLRDELRYLNLLLGGNEGKPYDSNRPPSDKGTTAGPPPESGSRGERDPDTFRRRLDRRILRTVDSGRFLPFAHLREVFQLSDLERNLFLLVAAPFLETARGRVSPKRHADMASETTLRAAMGLLGPRLGDRNELIRSLHPSRPLIRWRLIGNMNATGREPGPDDPLAPDPAVVLFLFGNALWTGSDPWLFPLNDETPAEEILSQDKHGMVQSLAQHFDNRGATGSAAIHLHGPDRDGKRATALELAKRLGFRVLALDLSQCPEKPEDRDRLLNRRLCLAIRNALLANAFLYLVGLDSTPSGQQRTLPPTYLKDLAESMWICFFDWASSEASVQQGPWRHRFILDFPVPRADQRERLWRRALLQWDMNEFLAPKLASGFPLCRHQIEGAASTARDQATLAGRPPNRIEAADLAAACRMQRQHELGDLAVKVPAVHDWADLVVDEPTLEHLHEITAFHRFGPRVYREWGFGKKMASGKGIGALFSGPSGTGKTMAASVIAANLNLELYKIDLANLVSKYIGETEKNLARIFREAEQAGAMLFFDEADALFGKRTEVRDAHDRYANLEVSYLLQRIEDYAGIIVLATNLLTNMDTAFLRRMRFIVEMPFPDRTMRERIWRVHLPEEAPLAGDVDLTFLAEKIKVTGGHIRNIVLAGAMLAASRDQPIGMVHFLAATKREYQKLGKTFMKSDFEPFSSQLN